MQLPLELIHIDAHFIHRYGNVSIPYTKAADHIFIVVAFVNKYPIVTWDGKMIKVAKEVGVRVYKPDQYVRN
jgi:predicted nucleic acid-binding protein